MNRGKTEKKWKKNRKKPQNIRKFFDVFVFCFQIDVEWQYLVVKIFPKCVYENLKISIGQPGKKIHIEDRKHNSLTISCELRCSRRARSSWSTGGIRCVTLVTNPVIRHEWGQDMDCDYDKQNIFEAIRYTNIFVTVDQVMVVTYIYGFQTLYVVVR